MKAEKIEFTKEVFEQEYSNMEKQLQLIEAEYNQYKERINQISDPPYLQELKEKIITLTHKEKRLQKSKKKLETTQKKKDTAIIRKEVAEPEITQAVNGLATESSELDSKLGETEAKLEKNAIALQDQITKLNETQSLLKKLSEEGGWLSLNVKEIIEPDHKNALKSEDILAELEAKKSALEKTLTLLKTRYSVNLGEYTQKKHQLQNEIAGIAANVQKKNE